MQAIHVHPDNVDICGYDIKHCKIKQDTLPPSIAHLRPSLPVHMMTAAYSTYSTYRNFPQFSLVVMRNLLAAAFLGKGQNLHGLFLLGS